MERFFGSPIPSLLAKLIGQTPTSPQRPGPGLCKGMITIVADDKEHLQDFSEYLP